MTSGSQSAELDFASVQRHNPEMERRCQQVIDACTKELSCPMSSIHDVGAGGLSNAFPELVHDSDLGAIFDLRCIPCDDPGMSPMEIWCNESQERYVLALPPVEGILSLFTEIAKRERCPFAIVGVATEEKRLVLKDTLFNNVPIDLPMSSLFGETPPLNCLDYSSKEIFPAFIPPSCSIEEMGSRVLQLPSVSSKSFLITIGDRSVTGLVARDQMVGPWQVPVADVSVTCVDYESYQGQAMCMGERTPIAIINPAGISDINIYYIH
jgi:phosphoribosylformylglycinamidine synthase